MDMSGRHPSEGVIVSERESEPGGVDYGGDRGGESGGSAGGQGGQGAAEGESGGMPSEEQEGQSGDGGRGPTERDGEPTARQGSDSSPTTSDADRAEEKQREMEESGEESPG
jgi:hypothetical protein